MPRAPALLAALAALSVAAAPPGSGRGLDAGSPAALRAELDRLRAEGESARSLGAQARLLHFLAEAASGEERERLHGEGLEVAKRALELDADEPSAILWWSAHLGSQATPARPLAAIRIASDVERALLRLRGLDPAYEHGAADRVLGHLYAVAPPVVSIGSPKKAEEHLRAALERAPRFPGNQLLWTDFLVRRSRCDAARKAVRVLQSSQELDRYPIEAPGWRRQLADLAERAASCR